MQVMMERYFWSIENIPLNAKNNLVMVTIIMNAVIIFHLLYAVCLGIGQFILDIFPKWPFIPGKVYPYYKIAYMVFISGLFACIYAHTLIFMYHCYHTYCQTLLLSEYIKRMDKDLSNLKDIKAVSRIYQSTINNRMLFGIKQHLRLMR